VVRHRREISRLRKAAPPVAAPGPASQPATPVPGSSQDIHGV
jgi:hypothetical protein